MRYVTDFFISLVELTNEMSPYLLLGFLIAGILHVYVKEEAIQKYLGKANFKSVLYAALIGVPLPLCSCGVIPTGVSIHKNGASKGAAISFLISTPQTGVDSIMATYSLIGLPFAIIRPIAAFLSGLLGGIIVNVTDKTQSSVQSNSQTDTCCSDNSCNSEKPNISNRFIEMLRYAFIDFMQDIVKWLLIGLLIAALISVVIPDDFFTLYLSNPILSMLIVLVVSVPLYVCATGSVPIAAVLLMKGLSPGAALVFLMGGPATNAATITVIGKTLGRKSLIAYLTSIIGVAVIFGLAIDYLFPRDLFTSFLTNMHHNHDHQLLPQWFSYSTSILLAGLMLFALLKRYDIIKSKQPIIISTMITKTYKVSGMTCNHCKANVEKNIAVISGISTVSVELQGGKVTISGENVDSKIIIETIEKIGYSVESEL